MLGNLKGKADGRCTIDGETNDNGNVTATKGAARTEEETAYDIVVTKPQSFVGGRTDATTTA